MHFFTSLIASAALLTSVIAQGIVFTEWPSNVKVGEPVTLKWAGRTDRPAIISLRKGPPENLDHVGVLTTDARDGSFEWTAPSDLPDGADYTFQIFQGGEVNYSGRFSVSGGSASISSATATGSSSAVSVMSAPTTFTTPNMPSRIAATPTSTLSTDPISVPRDGPLNQPTVSPPSHTAYHKPGSPTPTVTGKARPTRLATGSAASLTRPLAQILGAIVVLACLI
ncbi:hypothetical protein VTN00DRAFT_5364 [Thermoascus crustaceus]|uniref:uncharacterized protein n=1 Tax=Thermoascus crustaceus TaxID=5088 RepID=UPI0037435517